MRLALFTALVLASAGSAPALAQASPQVLVLDAGVHGYAYTGALALYPTSVTLATTGDFGTKLQSQAWDAVVLSIPGSIPTSGWAPVVSYINGGGKAVLAFWDWDNSAALGDPALLTAFEVSSPKTLTLNSAQPLTDSGTSGVFAGVTMPNADWHNHSADDGDEFTPTGSAIGLAHIGNPATPCMVLGNQGRTIAAPLITEAGDTWINDGSIQKLWQNMLDEVLTGGCSPQTASVLSRTGTPPNPDVFQVPPGQVPKIGGLLMPFVDHSQFMPSAILDVVSICAFPTNQPSPSGTLLVDIGLQVGFQVANAGQPFALPVPLDCGFVGVPVHLQVGSLSVTELRLTNALDLIIGTQ